MQWILWLVAGRNRRWKLILQVTRPSWFVLVMSFLNYPVLHKATEIYLLLHSSIKQNKIAHPFTLTAYVWTYWKFWAKTDGKAGWKSNLLVLQVTKSRQLFEYFWDIMRKKKERKRKLPGEVSSNCLDCMEIYRK